MARGRCRRYSVIQTRDLISPSEIGTPAAFWSLPVVVERRAEHWRTCTKFARRESGKLRSGLYYLRPRDIEHHEKQKFLDFMHVERPFIGDYTVIISGENQGSYAFVEKQDAALFKLFWC